MSSDGFFFNVKQWLGDDAILLMDWDTRAIHLHFMCLAWQQTDPGSLPDNELMLRRWAGNPSELEWTNRIRPQLAHAWTIANGLWVQEGLRREWLRQSTNSQKRRAAAHARWGKSEPTPLPLESEPSALPLVDLSGEPRFLADDAAQVGFNLSSALKEHASFLEPASSEERSTIWSVGVSLLKHGDFTETKARSYLGKLIQEHGEKKVAEALASLSLKPIAAADAKSYLIGILKGESNRRKTRGRVAL